MTSGNPSSETQPGAPAGGTASTGRCTSRRAAREARERGFVPPPAALEAPLYRPFALLAAVVTLAVATPIGAVALFRLYASAGPVPAIWPRLHAHLQVFGFAGVLILGMGQHLILRFSHAPIRRPACIPWVLGLVTLGLALRLAAAALSGAAAGPLWVGSAIAEAVAYAIFAVWVTARLSVAEPRFPSDWLMVSGAWWFALALGVEAFAVIRALAAGGDPTAAVPGPGLYAMGLYGGVFGWVLGVAMRVAPMFLTGGRMTRLGGPAFLSLNAAVLFGLLAEAWPPASRAAQIFPALSDLGLAAALVVTTVAVGAWRAEPRNALALHLDRTESRFFRLAFACAAAGAVGLVVGAAFTLAGAPLRGLLMDATRHLLTVGFLIGMICAMSFRFIPVIEGVPLAAPVARTVAFWTLAGSVLLRTVELGADYLHEGFLRLAAVSGFLAWLALGCWGLAVILTMLRGAVVRRGGAPKPADAPVLT